MTLPLLILRPMARARETERLAIAAGLRAVVDPLFLVEPLPWSAPPAAAFDALLLTSAHAVVHGGRQLENYRSLPVLAVGAKSADAAKRAGFSVAMSGSAGVEELLGQLEPGGFDKILWLSGEQHMTPDPGDRTIETVPVYRARALALGDRAQTCLADESAILLHSPRAARQLTSELARLDIDKAQHHLLAFSAKVAAAAGSGWKSVQIADQPDDAALLSLATTVCQ